MRTVKSEDVGALPATPIHHHAAHCANTRCTICKHHGKMGNHVAHATAISVCPCRGRPACLPFCGNVCPCATMFALQRNAAYCACRCEWAWRQRTYGGGGHHKTGQTRRFAPTLHPTASQYAPPRCKRAIVGANFTAKHAPLGV